MMVKKKHSKAKVYVLAMLPGFFLVFVALPLIIFSLLNILSLVEPNSIACSDANAKLVCQNDELSNYDQLIGIGIFSFTVGVAWIFIAPIIVSILRTKAKKRDH